MVPEDTGGEDEVPADCVDAGILIDVSVEETVESPRVVV